MNKLLKVLVSTVAAATLLTSYCVAYTPYYSYNYIKDGESVTDVAAPVPYTASRIINALDIKASEDMVAPTDMVKDTDGNIYIVDGATNCLLVLDSNYKLLDTIKAFGASTWAQQHFNYTVKEEKTDGESSTPADASSASTETSSIPADTSSAQEDTTSSEPIVTAAPNEETADTQESDTASGDNAAAEAPAEDVATSKETGIYDSWDALLADYPDSLNTAGGLFVTKDKMVYIADTGNNRIVVLDANNGFAVTNLILDIKSEVLGNQFKFKPQKIVVDDAGRIFIINKDDTNGLMELTNAGDFIGYVGANTVQATAIQLLWRQFYSEEQLAKISQLIPVEFQNISLDSSGCIYGVTAVKYSDNPVRRLNPSGTDILIKSDALGQKKVIGDYNYYNKYNDPTTGQSSFVDIVSDDYGNYYALDSRRGRVFCFDEEGNIMYIFGGLNSGQKGTFSLPAAIELNGDDIIVLDTNNANITVFSPTDYVEDLLLASKSYRNCDYEESYNYWVNILKRNNNLTLAYVKAGFCIYRTASTAKTDAEKLEMYQQAMDYFIVARARTQYSKAYTKYRRINTDHNFETYVIWILVIVVLMFANGIANSKARKHGYKNWRKRAFAKRQAG